jgi:uncharacterized membrane protein
VASAKTIRNIVIIGVIALAVDLIPGGGRAANTFEAALLSAFAFGIGYLGVRLWREYRIAIHGLGDHHRALLYGSVAAAAFDILGRSRMWESSLGELVWFILLGLVIYSLLAVYRRWRAY